MKKKTLLALLLAGVLALALTACGGSSGSAPAAEEAPDYLGTYNIAKIELGPLVVSPTEFGYGDCYMELKADGKLIFNDGADSEEEPYTVDGTVFTMEENGSTINGSIENDVVSLNMTAEALGGEGDQVAMVMFFGKAGSDAEAALKDETAQAGSIEEQVDAMSADQVTQFMDEYGYLFGS